MFLNGRFVDVAHSTRRSTVICLKIKQQIVQCTRNYRGISNNETASEMSNSHEINMCKKGLRPNLNTNHSDESIFLWTTKQMHLKAEKLCNNI
jgi:hypothetical protein